MIKKILLASIVIISILAIQHSPQAAETLWVETVGLWAIIYEEKNISEVEHGFLINDLWYTLIKLHMLVAGKDPVQINYQWETLETIKRLEELTKTDIIETLYLAEDKQVALAKYLWDCQQELQKWDAISAYMKQEMELIKGDMEACIVEKNIQDKAYFEAMARYDQNIMEVSLTESIKYEKCATENRIQYNAKAEIAKKLVFYLGLLQKKYDMLFAKQDIVTKTFEIFKENLLPDLNEIDMLLKQYTF